MPPYKYTPLDLDAGEIRLLELHPGAFDENIKISIFRKPFVPLIPKLSCDDRLEKMRETLPRKCQAYETLECRIVYLKTFNGSSQWNHHDPHYNGQSGGVTGDVSVKVEPMFEALSYTWGSETRRIAIEVVPLPKPPVRGFHWISKLCSYGPTSMKLLNTYEVVQVPESCGLTPLASTRTIY